MKLCEPLNDEASSRRAHQVVGEVRCFRPGSDWRWELVYLLHKLTTTMERAGNLSSQKIKSIWCGVSWKGFPKNFIPVPVQPLVEVDGSLGRFHLLLGKPHRSSDIRPNHNI